MKYNGTYYQLYLEIVAYYNVILFEYKYRSERCINDYSRGLLYNVIFQYKIQIRAKFHNCTKILNEMMRVIFDGNSLKAK